MIKRRMTQRDKTLRAVSVYLELIDTAEWMKRELRGQLASFDITFPAFRVVELIFRLGPKEVSIAAKELGYNRQNLDVILVGLMNRGWVRKEIVRLPAAKIKGSRLPKERRGKPRLGRRVAKLSMTPAGDKFMRYFLPKHAKMIKAILRALEGREQDTLINVCRKLREGNIVKFISEITHLEVEEVRQAKLMAGGTEATTQQQ